MIRIFSRLVHSLFPASVPALGNGVAHTLMENAESLAGRNPWQAQELRDAARAYLSVVR